MYCSLPASLPAEAPHGKLARQCPFPESARLPLLPLTRSHDAMACSNLQDPEAVVRDSSVEAIVSIAHAYTVAAAANVPGTVASPIVKLIFDSLAEQKKEVQAAASTCLGLVRALSACCC